MNAVALAALLVSTAAAHAADEYPILVYPCPLVARAPQLDGVLDDACWAEAPAVGGFTLYNAPDKPVPVQTAFRVVCSDGWLYLGVHCTEPLLDRIAPVRSPRDDPAIFGHEAIEVFVDPRHDHTTYYQFGVDFAGSPFDGKGFDRTWNCDARAATAPVADGWCAEIALPLRELGASTGPGAVIGLNVCRDRYLGVEREWTNWSQTAANFHDPVHFGHVVLGGPAEALGKLGPELRKGDRQGPIRIFGAGGYSGSAYLELCRGALAEVDELIAAVEAQSRREDPPATQRAVGAHLEAVRQEIAPYRERLRASADLSAEAWVAMDVLFRQTAERLKTTIWEARLEGLLSEL